MAKPQEIAEYKKQYADYTDEQLIAEQHMWASHSAMYIAAVQLLHERQKAKEQTNHAELLAEIKRPHWSVTPLFLVSVVAAVAACIAAYPVLFPSPAFQSARVATPAHAVTGASQKQSRSSTQQQTNTPKK